MDLRLLFIGFQDSEIPVQLNGENFTKRSIEKSARNPKRDSEGELVYYTFNYDNILPTFYDYNLVILKNPDEIYNVDESWSNVEMREALKEKKGQVETFLKRGGILVTFLVKRNKNNYFWCPLKLDIVDNSGEEIIPEDTFFKSIINKENFYYFTHFSENYDPKKENDIVLAKNIYDFPLSIIKKVEKGHIIFLPVYKHADFQPHFLRELIDIIKKNIMIKPGAKSIQPQWLENYSFPDENKLYEEVNLKIQKLKEYNMAKQILYEKSEFLVDSVAEIFKIFRFQTENKDKQGLQDIEIHHNNFYAVIEVKGKDDKPADLSDLRQLLHWSIDKKTEDESKTIKPIFIINHYRNKDIRERKEPYTENAIALGKKHEFCLLTTYDLFQLYKKFINKEIDIEKIKEILLQDGLIELT